MVCHSPISVKRRRVISYSNDFYLPSLRVEEGGSVSSPCGSDTNNSIAPHLDYLTGAEGLWRGLDELGDEACRRGAASRWQEHTGGARPTASRPSHPTGGTKEKISAMTYNSFFMENLILFSVLRIRLFYPGSLIVIFIHPGSRISDPGSNNSTKRGGGKNFVVLPFL
jgi:hypothetical protein